MLIGPGAITAMRVMFKKT